MDDLDGIPRKGHEPDGIRGMWKVIRSLQDSIRVLQRAAPQRSMSLTDGGDLTIKNRGRVIIEDEGEVNVVGKGRGYSSDKLIQVVATLANRMAYNAWIGFSYLVPGLYFTADGESQGPYDPRVVSADGKGVDAYSAVEDLPYGPQVGPNIKSRGSFGAGTWRAGIGVTAWDDSINPGGGDGVAGVRGAGSIGVTPWDLSILLTNHTDGPDGIPSGAAIWMRGDLDEGMLRIYTRNGVDIEGSFTVNGQRVGGAVTSVAGKTGDVLLVKGDVGLGSVDNTADLAKPVSTATQTALNGKASATHTHATATTTAPGFISAADKSKLDSANASASTGTLVYRDAWGRAQIADPVTGPDISNKGYVDSQTTKVRHADYAATFTLPSSPLEQYIPGTLAAVAATTVNNDFATVPGPDSITLAAGVYAILFFVNCGASMGGDPNLSIKNNAGAKFTGNSLVANTWDGGLVHPNLYLNATTTIRFSLRQSSGSTRTCTATVSIEKIK